MEAEGDWCTFNEALTAFEQAYGSERALGELLDALEQGVLEARAGMQQALDQLGVPMGQARGEESIPRYQWEAVAITSRDQGQVTRPEHGGCRRFYDVRVRRDLLQAMLGGPLQNPVKPRAGRPTQQARFEIAARVAMQWCRRSASERASASIKMIANDVATEAAKRKLTVPDDAITTMATAIRREVRSLHE